MAINSAGPSANPQLADVILKVKNDIFYSMNCVQIGKIKAYDPITNTASIAIQFKKNIASGSTLDYPLLVNCPVFVLTGGSASVSMPIEAGDTCIILFNDRNIDNWYYTGDVDLPANGRAHDIADGIAIVGISDLTSVSPTSTSSLRIDAGDKFVAIKNDTTDLLTLTKSLIDEIGTLVTAINNINTGIAAITFNYVAPATPATVQPGVTAIPNNVATFTALTSTLTTISTAFTTIKANYATLLNEGTP